MIATHTQTPIHKELHTDRQTDNTQTHNKSLINLEELGEVKGKFCKWMRLPTERQMNSETRRKHYMEMTS